AAELVVYPGIVEIGHAIIAEAFSTRVIQPGITTTDDVVWWMRQTMQSLGLRAWFHPTIDIQAHGEHFEKKDGKRKLILPGDLLHCDIGFTYLGLATDQQQNAYVLKPGESDAPAGLKAVLADGNRLQAIHMEAMIVGRTGNAVLQATLAQAKAEGLNPTVYSHPLGYHGHAAGPTIGLWDQQGGVPGRGDYELFDDTCYSIELNAKKAVPEWDGQEVRMALEEDAVLNGGQMRWLDGRQTELYLIR
ncbi:MAG: M24 family metallopeptidase, partial [Chloroflexota bacterium]